MKKFIITEEEKSRILNMHKTMTKRNYLINEDTNPDYKPLYGKTVKLTPVNIVEMTDVETNDYYDFDEYISQQTLGDKDKSFIESLKNNPLIGTVSPIPSGYDDMNSSDTHRINVQLEGNALGIPNIFFRYKCNTEYFFTKFFIKPQLSTTFANFYIKIEYKCDGLKDVLDGMYPCKTDFAKVDTTEIPDNLA